MKSFNTALATVAITAVASADPFESEGKEEVIYNNPYSKSSEGVKRIQVPLEAQEKSVDDLAETPFNQLYDT